MKQPPFAKQRENELFPNQASIFSQTQPIQPPRKKERHSTPLHPHSMNNPKYDFLIVGAGLYGAVFAYQAKKAGKHSLVIDKRTHTGGNLHCQELEGINVHKYGAHIFHTSNREIWQFVNSLVEFNRFTNSPVANYQGKLYNLPFNMNTFNQMWGTKTPEEAEAKINEQRSEALENIKTQGIVTPRNLEEQALTLVGKDIYQRLVKGYTEKQWGRKCSELPAFIIKRLPVRFTFDNNYFNDTFQGIPIGGYNRLINTMLEGIETQLETNYFSERNYFNSIAKKIIFTGQIDQFYDYRFGNLEYRTVRFEHKTLQTPNFQGNAVVNYTEASIPYTRIIEHKHFETFGQDVYKNPHTVVSHEYPQEWKPGMEPYYPVNNQRNTKLYEQYRSLADNETNVIFGGRLAEYKYYDMAPIIERAIQTFQNTQR